MMAKAGMRICMERGSEAAEPRRSPYLSPLVIFLPLSPSLGTALDMSMVCAMGVWVTTPMWEYRQRALSPMTAMRTWWDYGTCSLGSIDRILMGGHAFYRSMS